jgi:lysyl-tRNA synthetase class 2
MLDKLINERRGKLKQLYNDGINPYPSHVRRDFLISDALGKFLFLNRSKKVISLVGRIRAIRDQGGVVFLDVSDGNGTIQCVFNKKELKKFEFWKSNLDIGDFIEIRGTLFKTKIGERSIFANQVKILVKSLRPLPKDWFGLKNEEERLRKRYIDLLLNKKEREVLEKRSDMVKTIRDFLTEEGFLEVETPVLQPIPGGALARPFVTHHNMLKQDFYLRVAPELYLKRLLVAGFEKVFEFARNFRNEGIDRDHNPEFTMLELYWAYQDYDGLMKFTKKLLKPFISGSWKEISYLDACKTYAGKGKMEIEKMDGVKLDQIFKKQIRPKLIKPTIIYNHPKSLSPLSKSVDGEPELTERFQFIINGAEIVNGFSELNDPIDQRERMKEQERMYRSGNQEATRLDEDFLEALEYGMPPAAGFGIGIDRLAAVYIGSDSIKDVIIFPTLRSRK